MRIHYSFFIVFIVLVASSAFALTTIKAPAVDANGRGALTSLEAKITQGTGEVYIDVDPYISVDTQQSARTAAEVAASEAGVDFKKFDIFFKIDARTHIVDGPSGGAAMALLAYAEFTEKRPRRDLAITGSIERDGSVGTVGGVAEKTLSLKDTNVKLFLIPRGQSKSQGKNVVLEGEKIGVQVAEVQNIKDMVKYAFTAEGSKVEAQVFEEQPLVVEKISPSSKQQPLAQIALEDIAVLQKMIGDLEKQNDTEILRESLNKSAFEAKYLVEQGYYYSAANLVFVAKLSAESVKLKDVRTTEFMKMVQELENEAEKIVFQPLTVENMEWRIGAKLRYYWALNKIKGIKKNIGFVDLSSLHTEFIAAKNWVAASKRMNEIAAGVGGSTLAKQGGTQEQALELIQVLNESQSYIIDSEVEQHYSGAVSAYQDGDYATALFDGLFAKALDQAAYKIEEQVGSDFAKGLRSSKDFVVYNESVWAEYYFIHSLYSLEQANVSNEFVFLANAVKLQELSWILKENIPAMKQLLLQDGTAGISYPATQNGKGFKIETKVVPQSNNEAFLLAALAILAVALFLLFVRRKMIARKAEAKPLSAVEKIEKLDELLVQGKISERSWKVLHERYSRQLKKSRSAFQTPKPKKKKH